MFARNSRYFALPESSPVNAEGERLRGKNLRFIAPAGSTFLHTVQGRDRLDLMAYKYYQEPTRWWLISDANPYAFPLDLLDRSPVNEEVLALVSVDMQDRMNSLVGDLSALGQVRNPLPAFDHSSLAVLAVTSSLRQQVISRIASHGLHYLTSFAWDDGMTAGELFTFEDRTAKQAWAELMHDLRELPGVLAVQSMAQDGMVRLVYNSAMVERDRILRIIAMRSFAVDELHSEAIERLGAQVGIPPNGPA